MCKHRLHGKSGPVGPDRIDDIMLGNELDVFGLEGAFYIGHGLNHHGRAEKPQACAGRQGFGQPLVPGQHIGLAQVHNVNFGVCQFLLGLQPVTTVGPDICAVFEYHHGGYRGSKAGHVFPHFPAQRHVLRVVRVRGGEHPGVELVFFHFRAQGGKALGNKCHGGGLQKIERLGGVTLAN